MSFGQRLHDPRQSNKPAQTAPGAREARLVILELQRLPATLLGPQGDGYHGQVPERARLLQADAAGSLLALDEVLGGMIYTDIYRSPESQLAAYRSKGGTQRPGFSGHGFGLSVDLDVGATLKRIGLTYAELTDELYHAGWACHRRDLDAQASESWHFNYLGKDLERLLPLADPQQHASWAAPLEAAIRARFGMQFCFGWPEIAVALQTAGVLGIHEDSPADAFKAAVEVFQRQWCLQADGVAGPQTQRLLAVATATVNVAEI